MPYIMLKYVSARKGQNMARTGRSYITGDWVIYTETRGGCDRRHMQLERKKQCLMRDFVGEGSFKAASTGPRTGRRRGYY